MQATKMIKTNTPMVIPTPYGGAPLISVWTNWGFTSLGMGGEGAAGAGGCTSPEKEFGRAHITQGNGTQATI